MLLFDITVLSDYVFDIVISICQKGTRFWGLDEYYCRASITLSGRRQL